MMLTMSCPADEITGLSSEENAAAQIVSSGASARASHPRNVLLSETSSGCEPVFGCSATIVYPVPCTLLLALKLHTTRSPFVKSPFVDGATVKPYGLS